MTSNSRTKETAIKGLITDIKSYCAALTPSALELLSHLPGEQGEALVRCWLAGTGSLLVPLVGCSIPAQQWSIFVRMRAASTLPPVMHLVRIDFCRTGTGRTALLAAAPRGSAWVPVRACSPLRVFVLWVVHLRRWQLGC